MFAWLFDRVRFFILCYSLEYVFVFVGRLVGGGNLRESVGASLGTGSRGGGFVERLQELLAAEEGRHQGPGLLGGFLCRGLDTS